MREEREKTKKKNKKQKIVNSQIHEINFKNV